jgi:hypothetical protein
LNKDGRQWLRSVRSLYQRARSSASGSSERRRGRRRGTTQEPPQEAEEEEAQVGQPDATEEEEDVQVAQEGEEEVEVEEEDEAQQTASASGASGSSSVYLRSKNLYMFSLLLYVIRSNVKLKLIIFLITCAGPASHPNRPIPRERRPLIRPEGEK